ncbi:MAG: baseplate J/gp47 family protein [Planctomycetota bacterium]
MTARAPERAFVTFPRGEIRDEILTSMRFGMRQVPNPDTGLPFTEAEIAVATARLSRFWIEADSIDLVLLAHQNRDLYFADQARIDRASQSYLTGYHGVLWGEQPLSAVGGSGPVDAPATVGTTFVGSTTVPDPAAVNGTDPAGLSYQVLFTVIATAGGTSTGADGAQLQLKGIDTGPDTNIDVAVEIDWSNGPPGAPAPAVVTTKFTGGFSEETAREFARRLLDRVRQKEGAGNNAQFRAWARQASTAVEDGFIYATALHAGSVRVCVTQKRGTTQGPTGRLASVGTLTDVTAFLTPPGSPVVPVPPYIVVTAHVAEDVVTTLALSLPFGQAAGWEDVDPFPSVGTGTPFNTFINAITTQTSFQITRGSGSKDLPAGVTAPSLMAWDPLTSRSEALNVTSVILNAGDVYDVILSAAPSFTLVAGGATVGSRISPDTERRALIAETIESYFDSLGPGELIDLNTDTRSHRAFRFPRPNEEFPQRAGSAIIAHLQDALGATLADAQQPEVSPTTPTLPTDPVDEPSLLVAGDVGIYPE